MCQAALQYSFEQQYSAAAAKHPDATRARWPSLADAAMHDAGMTMLEVYHLQAAQ